LTAQIATFKTNSTALPCTVCCREPEAGIGWFLLSENTWFDTIRIFHWHPALAEVPEMHAVCCKQHLRTLLTHWLSYADLDFTARDAYQLPISSCVGMADHVQGGIFPTALVGELAVYRETLSRAWNGSAQTLQAILNALLDEMIDEAPPEKPIETKLEVPPFNLPGAAVETFGHYALHN
jgi:hypothetical protein